MHQGRDLIKILIMVKIVQNEIFHFGVVALETTKRKAGPRYQCVCVVHRRLCWFRTETAKQEEATLRTGTIGATQ